MNDVDPSGGSAPWFDQVVPEYVVDDGTSGRLRAHRVERGTR